MLVTDLNQKNGLLGHSLLQLKEAGHTVYVLESNLNHEFLPVTYGLVEGPKGLAYIQTTSLQPFCIDISYYIDPSKRNGSSRGVASGEAELNMNLVKHAQEYSCYRSLEDYRAYGAVNRILNYVKL